MTSDHELAHDLALDAGRVLLELRAREPAGRDRGAAGDARSGEYISRQLRAERPSDAVLMEDSSDDATRLASERVWIIDPLDGTREFGEDGRVDWAVHVALCESGVITAAAVALPARDIVLSTQAPRTTATEPAAGSPLRVVVSRSRPAPFAAALAASSGLELVPLGSAGFKTAAVVLGEADAYVHAGGQYEWDSAAPAGVALAAGFHASRVDGSPLRYNQANPWQPDVLICRPGVAQSLLAQISKLAA